MATREEMKIELEELRKKVQESGALVSNDVEEVSKILRSEMEAMKLASEEALGAKTAELKQLKADNAKLQRALDASSEKLNALVDIQVSENKNLSKGHSVGDGELVMEGNRWKVESCLELRDLVDEHRRRMHDDRMHVALLKRVS